MDPINPHAPFDEPGKVSVEDGIVLVDGPDGVAIALTPPRRPGDGRTPRSGGPRGGIRPNLTVTAMQGLDQDQAITSERTQPLKP